MSTHYCFLKSKTKQNLWDLTVNGMFAIRCDFKARILIKSVSCTMQVFCLVIRAPGYQYDMVVRQEVP
jgi:hypothetical protein